MKNGSENKLEQIIFGANLLVMDGQVDDAILVFQKVLKDFPQNGEANKGLGNAYALKNNYAMALGFLQDAQKLDPADDELHGLIGTALFFLDRFPESINEFKIALENTPNNFDTRFLLARCYDKLGLHENALEEYNKGAWIENFKQRYFILGVVMYYAEKKQIDKAKELVNNYLRKAPNNPDAHQILGLILEDIGDVQEAKKEYQVAKALGYVG